MKSEIYLANKSPHQGLPKPIITLFCDLHLMSHNLRRCHWPARSRRRQSIWKIWARPIGAMGARRRRVRATTPTGRHSSRWWSFQDFQPKCTFDPTSRRHHHRICLRPRRPISIATIFRIRRGVKCESVPTSKARRGAASREEDLVGGFPDVITVNSVEFVKWPH